MPTRAPFVALLALSSCVRPPALAIAEPTIEAAPPAPPRRSLPISGGTLRISRDGQLAAVSDPEGDRVWIVELAPLRVRAEVMLAPGDEPGRIVEDFGLRFHVALRRGGAIVTIDDRGELLLRRPVCPAPRGIDLDPSGDLLHVACAGGELVTFGVFDRAPLRTVYLEPDLRDVIAAHDRLHVTRFRSAEVLTVDASGSVSKVQRPSAWDLDAFENVSVVDRPRRTYEPNVAWRLVKDPRSNRLWMLHQRAARFPVDLRVEREPPPASGYGGFRASLRSSCDPGISHAAITAVHEMPDASSAPSVESALSVLDRFEMARAEGPAGAILQDAVLPIDVAFAPGGAHVAMAFPGNATRQLAITRVTELSDRTCASSLWEPGLAFPQAFEQPVAVAWIDDSRLVVQYREPHALVVYTTSGREDGRFVELGERTPRDRGHDVFHEGTSTHLACASCHPEVTVICRV